MVLLNAAFSVSATSRAGEPWSFRCSSSRPTDLDVHAPPALFFFFLFIFVTVILWRNIVPCCSCVLPQELSAIYNSESGSIDVSRISQEPLVKTAGHWLHSFIKTLILKLKLASNLYHSVQTALLPALGITYWLTVVETCKCRAVFLFLCSSRTTGKTTKNLDLVMTKARVYRVYQYRARRGQDLCKPHSAEPVQTKFHRSESTLFGHCSLALSPKWGSGTVELSVYVGADIR